MGLNNGWGPPRKMRHPHAEQDRVRLTKATHLRQPAHMSWNRPNRSWSTRAQQGRTHDATNNLHTLQNPTARLANRLRPVNILCILAGVSLGNNTRLKPM